MQSNITTLSNAIITTNTNVTNYSNYESSRVASLSNFAYSIQSSNSVVNNFYTSNIITKTITSSDGGTIGALLMSGAGLALGGYNLLNQNGRLVNSLQDTLGKLNINPNGSVELQSLLGKIGRYTDSVQIGVSTIELSNNTIFFKDGATSNMTLTSNAITILNNNISTFTISNANIVTNCNIVATNITTLSNQLNSTSNTATSASNVAYWSSNNLVKRSGDYMSYLSTDKITLPANANLIGSGWDYITDWTPLGVSGGYVLRNNNEGGLEIYTGKSNSIGMAMTITSNGNVGVGTYTPSTKLDVNGTINAQNYTGTTITNLSNLGMSASNVAHWSSNNTGTLSNAFYTSTTSTTAINASNVAHWSSNNLLNKAGGTMTGNLSIIRGAGNPTTLSINSTGSANTQSTIQFVNNGHQITCVDTNFNGWTRPGSGHNIFYQSGGHYFNGAVVFDNTIGGNAITALSNMAIFGSNTAVWGSNTARWSSNYGGTLCNLATDALNRGTFGSNAGGWASNNFVSPTVSNLSVTGDVFFRAGLTASPGTLTHFPFSGGFANNGKNFIRGTTILADTSNAERVGIGLNNPTEKFHVNGTSLLKELIVGDLGNLISHIGIRQATIVGSGGASVVSTTFTGTFPSSYAVFPTVELGDGTTNDVFACSIQSKSTSEIKVVTSRADNGTSWAQTITLRILVVGI
jgi:hypothetical protein